MAVDRVMREEYSNLLHKPIFLQSRQWTSAMSPGDSVVSLKVPDVFFASPLLEYPFRMNSYWRGKAHFLLQVQGTPFHSGALIACVTPARFYEGQLLINNTPCYNTFCMANPILLGANDSSTAELEIPFYCATDLAVCRTQRAHNAVPDYATYDISSAYTANLDIIVGVILTPSTSASTSIFINISVVFDDLEFYIPRVLGTYAPTFLQGSLEEDFKEESIISTLIDKSIPPLKDLTADLIDRARAALKTYTGLDKPNISNPLMAMKTWSHNTFNNVQGVDFLERFTFYPKFLSVAEPATFDTDIDETDCSFIASKYGAIGVMGVTANDIQGTLLFSCPVTPHVAPFNAIAGQSQYLTPLSLLYLSSKYWSGGITFNIYSSMVLSQNVNLVAVVVYSPSPYVGQPSLASLTGCPMWQFEFSGGNQEREFTVPYNAVTPCLPTTMYFKENAMQHAMLYIYLKSPMTTSNGAPFRAWFVMRMKGDKDMTFYGPRDNITCVSSVNSLPVPGFKAESSEIVDTPLDICDCTEDLNMSKRKKDISIMAPLLTVNDMYKKYTCQGYYTITNPSLYNFQSFQLRSSVYGNRNNTGTGVYNNTFLLPSTYFGFKGGLRYKIRSNAALIATYVHPALVDTTDPFTGNVGCLKTEDAFSSAYLTALGGSIVASPFFPAHYSVEEQGGSHFLEFEAPCEMSWRFHKTPHIDRSLSYAVVAPISPAALVGTIIVRAADTALTTPVSFTVWTSISDEGRYGMQSLNFPVQINSPNAIPGPTYLAAITPTNGEYNAWYKSVDFSIF
jgi:hypothetical protein